MINKRVLSVAGIYCATVLGAGFISGRELLSYFLRFGGFGAALLVAASALIGYLGYKALYIAYLLKSQSYNEFLVDISGSLMGGLLEIVSLLFLLVIFSAMLSGGGSGGQEFFGANKLWFSIGLSLICFIVFLGRLKALASVSLLLCPFMVIGGIAVSLCALFSDSAVFSDAASVLSPSYHALSFCAYNLLSAIPVLVSSRVLISSREEAFLSGMLAGLGIASLGFFLSLALIRFLPLIGDAQLPLLRLTELISMNDKLKGLYFFLLMGGILTTALGSGFAFIEEIKRLTGLSHPIACLIAVLLALFLSQISFASLVDKGYMIFGIFSFLLIYKLFVYKVENKHN